MTDELIDKKNTGVRSQNTEIGQKGVFFKGLLKGAQLTGLNLHSQSLTGACDLEFLKPLLQGDMPAVLT